MFLWNEATPTSHGFILFKKNLTRVFSNLHGVKFLMLNG